MRQAPAGQRRAVHNPGMTRVLVVDDEPSIRQLVATLLTLEGFDVATAEDGRDAMDQVLAVAPDIVVSDVRMPRLNGCELLAALRANPALLGLRFVLLTNLADTDATIDHAIAQADACLTKPFTRELLLNTLRQLRA